MKKTKEKDYFYKLKMKRDLYVGIVFITIATICFILGIKLSNPNTDSSINIFIGFMAIMILVGIVVIIKSFGKIIKYNMTLNGKEVEADFIRVIERNDWSGKKSFILECKWKDINDVEYTFYSEAFHEPYFMKEFEKLNIEKLTVRFKEENKSQYIVLTEKIDKRLSK